MQARSRQFWLVKQRYRLGSLVSHAREDIEMVRTDVLGLLRAFALGGLLVVAVLAIEKVLTVYVALPLVPGEDSLPLVGAFPTLAVQVSASLLGFYLASVGIVLGTSYRDVPTDVRGLVHGSARTRLHLASIGMSIGAGLTLILLPSLGFLFGYLAVTLYALLVVFSAWAFVRLAFGAFNLFNPIVLGEEPLRALYRAIDRLGSKGLLGDEAVLRARSQEANRALGILANLVKLTSERASVDKNDLARMVERLLACVRCYATRKHLLSPNSAWFPLAPAYPRWVEAEHWAMSIALNTSTPLRPRIEPVTDWLERRTAEVAAAALEACVTADDRYPALRVTRAVASTAQTLAQCSRLDDAITFAGIVRDRCCAIESQNAAAVEIAAEPPSMLTHILLGWRDAIASWPEEIRRVVASTQWDRARTTAVELRGTTRVWNAAQRLLREVHAEHEIEERRVTPDWYLRFALAQESILSLHEFADQLPKLLDDYFAGTAMAHSSPVAKAATATQALQTLAKAESLSRAIPLAVQDLENLCPGQDPQPTEDFECLLERVRARRSPILERLADAVTELRPERSRSDPDHFGQALLTLVHHAEQAIASGDVALVSSVFSKILAATMILEKHVASTYKPRTYQLNPAIFDPGMNLLELSGLALIYQTLRDDRSAEPICLAWQTHIQSIQQGEEAAQHVLNVLDLVDGRFTFGIFSPGSMTRSEWEMRLSKQIVEAGYARPKHLRFGGQPTWTAPPLIKMLGVSASMPRVHLHPRAIFAAEVIGPLSGESEEMLRTRPGLKRYYQARDRRGMSDIPNDAIEDEIEGNEDSSP